MLRGAIGANQAVIIDIVHIYVHRYGRTDKEIWRERISILSAILQAVSYSCRNLTIKTLGIDFSSPCIKLWQELEDEEWLRIFSCNTRPHRCATAATSPLLVLYEGIWFHITPFCSAAAVVRRMWSRAQGSDILWLRMVTPCYVVWLVCEFALDGGVSQSLLDLDWVD